MEILLGSYINKKIVASVLLPVPLKNKTTKEQKNNVPILFYYKTDNFRFIMTSQYNFVVDKQIVVINNQQQRQ